MKDWQLIVVGDKKTPHEDYKKLNCLYMHPDEQEKRYPKLSQLIGWNSIQRRNLGYVFAYQAGADIVATVDDDNIPYKNWGQNLSLEKPITAARYTTPNPVFDPLSVTEYPELWHRGYPIQLMKDRFDNYYEGEEQRKFLVQADLWDGDPDVDAICRMMYAPQVKFDKKYLPFFSDKPSPFNSQNTFLSRKVLPYFFLFPHIGRMDDIWASYLVQSKFPKSVVYCAPSVVQKRNEHNLMDDMRAEMLGYEKSLEFATTLNFNLLPKESREAYKEYQRLLK